MYFPKAFNNSYPFETPRTKKNVECNFRSKVVDGLLTSLKPPKNTKGVQDRETEIPIPPKLYPEHDEFTFAYSISHIVEESRKSNNSDNNKNNNNTNKMEIDPVTPNKSDISHNGNYISFDFKIAF